MYTTRISCGMGGGSAAGRSEQAVISKLKLANGDYLEQWHDSMSEAGRTLSTTDKKLTQGTFPSAAVASANHTRVTVPPGHYREEKGFRQTANV